MMSSASSCLRSDEFWVQFKSHGPRLVPFFKTLAAYFVIFIPSEHPSLFAMILKCLPISALALFVCLYGVRTNSKHYTFSRRILLALIFSLIGDACLIWPSYFPHGMASFAVAQICYIWAFGWRERPNYFLGFIIFLFNSVGLGILLPSMPSNVPLEVKFGLPVYSFLLMTMLWRAIDRTDSLKNASWTNTCSCLGGMIFVVSDMILGFNMFYTKIPHAQAYVMLTYYAAQLALTLSIVNSDSVNENNSVESKATKEVKEVQPVPQTTKTRKLCSNNSSNAVNSSL